MAQNFKTKKITLDSLNVGQVIELTYIAPNKGRVIVNFDGEDDNIVLHISIRYENNALVLNTKQGGWGHEERPGGFSFVHGNAVTLRIAVQDKFYSLYCNGNAIGNYKHRTPIGGVKAISWRFEDSNADVKANLQSFNINFA